MTLFALSPVLLAISLSTTALVSDGQDAAPAPEPAPAPESKPAPTEARDPRDLLADEYRRLEALRAQVKAAERAAEEAKLRAATATAATTPVAVAVRTGPRATMLAPVRLQPASGLDSAARGLMPESEWRQMFPKR